MSDYLTLRQRLEQRRAQLDLERQSFISHWRELNEYISPRSARFLTTDRNKGEKRNQKIINSTATFALNILRSGMMGGITSPARPWFMLQTSDPDLNEFAPVKEWLYDVTQRMRTVLSKSNFYNAMPVLYHDIGLYGTHAMAILEDDEDVIRCYTFPIGSYMLANSSRLQIDTCVREFSMTTRQMADFFGKENCSTRVQNLLDRGDYNTWIDVVHVIEPNVNYDGSKLDARFKRYASIYYEKDTNERDRLLSESGFDTFPIIAPRWDVVGEDVYGSSPGMVALGDVKQLQLEEKRKAEAIDKLVRPPMNAPSSMRNRRASILPGDINYVDVNQGQQGFTPAYQIDPRINELMADIQAIEQRINRAFFADLFLMMTNMPGVQPRTAEEIAERHEEKLLMLGPVLERMNDEALEPAIDRVFEIMLRRGMLPPPPEELQGMVLKVEYTSIIAQAQKLVGAASIERFTSFVGNLAAVKPDVLDRYDVDEAIDTYAEIVGAPPKLVVPLDEANAVREQRAQQVAAQQAMQMGMAAAQGAELLSKTDTGSDNALTRIAQGLTGAPA